MQVVTVKVKLLEHMDFIFIKEFESREGLKGDFEDLLSAKLHLDALN